MAMLEYKYLYLWIFIHGYIQVVEERGHVHIHI